MKTMRGESGLIGGLLGLALLAMAGTTQASLVQDLTVTDPFDPGPFPGPGFTGIGQISFDTRSGDDPLGVVDFSFTPSSSFVVGPLPTFTEDDIVSVSWAIDESWTLTDFSLYARVTTVALFEIGLDLVAYAPVGDICGFSFTPKANYLCRRNDNGTGQGAPGRDLSANAVHVPEPASLGLFLIALGGLGFMMRRRGP